MFRESRQYCWDIINILQPKLFGNTDTTKLNVKYVQILYGNVNPVPDPCHLVYLGCIVNISRDPYCYNIFAEDAYSLVV